jgi:hypothetical protein
VNKGEAAVIPFGELRKWCRVRKLTAEHCQKRKERTWGKSGSKRKLAATCRMVSHCAKMEWRKRKLARRIGTQENCGLRKEFSPAGIRMTHSGKNTDSRDKSKTIVN